MVKKVRLKYFFSIFRQNLPTLFALLMIIAVSIGFTAGIGTSPQLAKESLSAYYNKRQTPDAIYYFEEDENSSALQAHENTAYAADFFHLEYKDESGINVRLIFINPENSPFIRLLEGDFFKRELSAAAEQNSSVIQNPPLGGSFVVFGKSLTVTAIVENPLYISKSKEPYLDTSEDIQRLIYLNINEFELQPNAVYIKFKNTENLSRFSNEYANLIEKNINSLMSGGILKSGTAVPFTQNVSFILLDETVKKISVLSYIFPVFFLFVAALSAIVGVTRLAERERGNIAVLKILGHCNGYIIMRYVFFAAVCSAAGGALGMIAGPPLLSTMIYNIFTLNFFMPQKTVGFYASYGFVASSIMTAVVCAAAFFVSLSPAASTPAALTLPKSPKAGRKIWLERLPFIWKRLKFKYKSSFRNVFRHTKNLILTVFSITGSGALVFAGLALQNSSDALKITAENGLLGMYKSMSAVSALIIICAAFLSILVIYNLANINIDQRKREIASLKVLGYTDGEVLGYIFRELMIMAAIGALLGLPSGYFLIKFIFSYVGFGSVTLIKWYVWPLSCAMILAFSALASLLLFKKIKKVDMNSSLKTVG